MGSVGFQFTQLGFRQISNPKLNSSRMVFITCGLRKWYKKPMFRSRVLSTEAIQAVQSLKLAKSPAQLNEVFSTRISRLLKADLLDTLTELQRQNELDLALKVFGFLKKEIWYKPDADLFSDMMRLMGKNKLVDNVEQLFHQLKNEGLEPDSRAYAELIGAYLSAEKIDNAMETYEYMKKSGCNPDELTLTILIRNLERLGEDELAAGVKNDCAEYMDFPNKFIKEIETKFPKRKPFNLV